MRNWMIVPEFDGIAQSFTPGKCFLCNAGRNGRQVLCSGQWIGGEPDDGINRRRVGKIQFCDECIKAAARLLGMLESDKADDLKTEARDATLAKDRAERSLAKLQDVEAAALAYAETIA